MTKSKIDVQAIETPLLKVPFESLKRTTRDRKQLIEEYSSVLNMLQSSDEDQSWDEEGASDKRDRILASAECRLAGLKRKLEAVSMVEAAELQRCRARLQHLITLGAPSRGAFIDWNRQRLNRLLADHLLRRGHVATANQLVANNDLQELVDLHIFQEAHTVAAALDRRDCQPALEWCALHASKLKKTRSQIVFKLRLQEFLELVRKKDTMAAIKYARAHLAMWANESCEEEHHRVFASIIFTSSTSCPVYQDMFSDERWSILKDLFLSELYRLHSLTNTSVLNIHLQAGLSALKVPQSLEEGANLKDPLHLEDFRTLAAELPFSKHVRSKLVCAITCTPIDEDNPPLVTPSGACYSEAGIKQVAGKHNGIFVDPTSGNRYKMSEMTRAYVS